MQLATANLHLKLARLVQIAQNFDHSFSLRQHFGFWKDATSYFMAVVAIISAKSQLQLYQQLHFANFINLINHPDPSRD